MSAAAGQAELHTFSLIKNLIDWLGLDMRFVALSTGLDGAAIMIDPPFWLRQDRRKMKAGKFGVPSKSGANQL